MVVPSSIDGDVGYKIKIGDVRYKTQIGDIRELGDYKKLIIWQKLMNLSVEIYKLTRSLPDNENFCLCSQMRRAVVSIPSNIAEGHTRQSKKEFIHFLRIAQGSNSELET